MDAQPSRASLIEVESQVGLGTGRVPGTGLIEHRRTERRASLAQCPLSGAERTGGHPGKRQNDSPLTARSGRQRNQHESLS